MKSFALLTLFVSGCAEVQQTDSCAAYVECIQAVDAQSDSTTDLDRFEVGGVCWGNPEGAALCDRACSNGLEWMRDAYSDLPEECAE